MYAINNLNPYFSASKAQQTKIKTFDNQKTLTPDEVKDVVNKLKNPDVLQILQENHKQTTTPLYFHYYSKTDLQEAERLKPIINDPVKGKQILKAILKELDEAGGLDSGTKAQLRPYMEDFPVKKVAFGSKKWVDQFAGKIKNHPFPDDYDFDKQEQEKKYLERFISPMGKWGEAFNYIYSNIMYGVPDKAYQNFINYYAKAYDNPVKRQAMNLLIIRNTTPEQTLFFIENMVKSNSNIINDAQDIIKATESVEGFIDLIGNNPDKKLKRLKEFIKNPDYYTKEQAVGRGIQIGNLIAGSKDVAAHILTGNIPGAILAGAVTLIGMKAGQSVSKRARSGEEKERFMAYMKHYILEDKIKFDDFAEIIFEGTDIKKT